RIDLDTGVGRHPDAERVDDFAIHLHPAARDPAIRLAPRAQAKLTHALGEARVFGTFCRFGRARHCHRIGANRLGQTRRGRSSMTADWANLEGHTINGVFPLLRLLGSSERSAVFLSRTATGTPSDIALKLVPAVAGRGEVLLPRWRAAAALD